MKKILQFILLLFSHAVLAQDNTTTEPPKVKFGKVIAADFATPNPFEADSAAHAVILYEKGNYDFRFSSSEGFLVHYITHIRMKILDKAGVNYATKEVPFHFDSDGLREDFISVEGYTFRLENGEVKKDKLTKAAIFEEKISEDTYRKKFTMPNVQPGCIIDFTYEITSNNTSSLKTWFFQSTKIPALWSVLQTNIPPYWQYNAVLTGYRKLHHTQYEKELQPAPFLSGSDGSNPTYTEMISTYAMKDVPALDEPQYTTNPYDYLAQATFDLASFDPPYDFKKKIGTTWQDIAANLLERKNFGEQLTANTDFIKKEQKANTNTNGESLEIMNFIFDKIKSTIKWNEEYGYYADETIDKTYKTKKGNAGSINLLLCNLLKAYSIDATPVLVSTRQYGKIIMAQPSYRSFNHVIVCAKINDKLYLLDATDPFAVPNLLPETCLHERGLRIIDAKNIEWLSLVGKERSLEQHLYELKLNADGTISGKHNTRYKNYEAKRERKRIKAQNSIDDYKSSLEKEHTGLTIKNIKITNLDSLQKPFLSVESDIEIQNRVQIAGDMIYCPYLFFENIIENPFKTAERVTPIHFNYIGGRDVMIRLTIPDGYKVEELPQNLTLTTSSEALKLSVVFQQKGNVIEYNSKVSFNNMKVDAFEYPSIQEWYSKTIAKHAEQIVIKKQ